MDTGCHQVLQWFTDMSQKPDPHFFISRQGTEAVVDMDFGASELK